MKITFDPKKDAANKRKHGVSLARAVDFDFDAAYIKVDDRSEYGEVRYRAISFLDARLFTLIFTETDVGIRVISLRKAERSEETDYANF